MRLRSTLIFVTFSILAAHIIYVSAQESAVALPTIENYGNIGKSNSNLLPHLHIPDSLLILAPSLTRSVGVMPCATNLGIDRASLLNGISSSVSIASWDGGGIYGISSISSMPALGNTHSATALFSHHIGDVTFTASLQGAKYHFDRSIYNDFNIAGRVSYRANDKIALSVFGNYSPSSAYHSAAAEPYTYQSSYGASVTYSPSKNFSIEAGVKRSYNPLTGRWELIPIVAPTVDIKGAKVATDFGGLIHHLVQSAVAPDEIRRSNPTVAPPKFPIPVR